MSLIRRVCAQIEAKKPVVFLVGSAITAPQGGSPGVPGVAQLCRDLCHRLGLPRDAKPPDDATTYQNLFGRLVAERGQSEANDFVRSAVLKARVRPTKSRPTRARAKVLASTDTACAALQADGYGWHINGATAALAEFVARFPATAGSSLLTTNFDPLIEIAIERAGGFAYSVAVHDDGSLPITHTRGTRVIHLHGFWLGSDTLHAPEQIGAPRPKLVRSLSRLLEHALLVAIGYDGWDDVFMAALRETLIDNQATPDVAWAFFSADAHRIVSTQSDLIAKLRPGIGRGRVHLYRGVDLHQFFPALLVRTTEPQAGGRPAESLQLYLDLVTHRFFRDRFTRRQHPDKDIGLETQALAAWGEHVPICAAILAVHDVLHIFENSLPHAPREIDWNDVDFWPRRCLCHAREWLLNRSNGPPKDELDMWPSIFVHAARDRRVLSQTIVSAVRYACEAVAIFRGHQFEAEVTSLMRAGQAVHCVMRAAGDDRLGVWSRTGSQLNALAERVGHPATSTEGNARRARTRKTIQGFL